MRYFRTLYFLAPMVLLFITCEEDATVEPPKDAPKLTFSKLTVDEKDVTKEQLLQQIKEREKAGFKGADWVGLYVSKRKGVLLQSWF